MRLAFPNTLPLYTDRLKGTNTTFAVLQHYHMNDYMTEFTPIPLISFELS